EEVAQQVKEQNPSQVVGYLVGFIVSQTLIVGVILFVVSVLSGANLRDLGMPASTRELARDVRIGFVAFLAALAPVHAIQQLLFYVLGLDKESSSHPLIQMVSGDEPNFTLLLLASVVAVIVAPLAEEILFRLLLQGWLEKWEDLWLGWRRSTPTNDPISDVVLQQILEQPNDALLAPVTIDETGQHAEPTSTISPTCGIARLPFGWMPILFSSLLFAIAHYGHGPDPVAIFVLALILGYVYQRTHRIVPTIVAHALFNAFAMVILWQMILSNAK
ncbi:MAG: CPBP family intramembrane metalloprotease, partial [Planctomycetes bacterium]|nr:CPBP family intramembrane metalloprotease [Planctomycetota bacterium]